MKICFRSSNTKWALTAQFLLLHVVILQTNTHGFSVLLLPLPTATIRERSCYYSYNLLYAKKSGHEDGDEDEDEDDLIEYDDFGGRFIGDDDGDRSASSSSSNKQTVLSDRMQELQQSEIRQEAVYTRNWKLGNWQVRGFSLEDETAVEETITTAEDGGEEDQEEVGEDIQAVAAPDAPAAAVCRIVKAAFSDDDYEDHDNLVWIGRTDGSVFGVRLGSAYWTKLQTNDDVSSPTSNKASGKPFEIVARINAGSSPVSALVAAAAAASSEEESSSSYLFTAADSSGIIQQWTVPPNDQSSKVIRSKQMQGVHDGNPVLWLKAVSMGDASNILLSACCRKIAVWDLVTGDLLGQCAVDDETSAEQDVDVSADDGGPIQCVDADGIYVFVGTATGNVIVYSIQDLLSHDDTALAVGQWRASNMGVTAVSCGGAGSLGRGRAGSETTVLYTGDAEGIVKQWEVFARTAGDNGTTKIEQWPKMATQRLPKKAHLFQGHQDKINAILAVDSVKFVSASADGTVRAWNTATGKELFRMDGFTEAVQSLCLLDSVVRSPTSSAAAESLSKVGELTTASNTILLCDGMDKYVCVHDFSTNPDHDNDADFDLDMPEYLNE